MMLILIIVAKGFWALFTGEVIDACVSSEMLPEVLGAGEAFATFLALQPIHALVLVDMITVAGA